MNASTNDNAIDTKSNLLKPTWKLALKHPKPKPNPILILTNPDNKIDKIIFFFTLT